MSSPRSVWERCQNASGVVSVKVEVAVAGQINECVVSAGGLEGMQLVCP